MKEKSYSLQLFVCIALNAFSSWSNIGNFVSCKHIFYVAVIPVSRFWILRMSVCVGKFILSFVYQSLNWRHFVKPLPLLSSFSASVFTGSQTSLAFQVPKPLSRDWVSKSSCCKSEANQSMSREAKWAQVYRTRGHESKGDEETGWCGYQAIHLKAITFQIG